MSFYVIFLAPKHISLSCQCTELLPSAAFHYWDLWECNNSDRLEKMDNEAPKPILFRIVIYLGKTKKGGDKERSHISAWESSAVREHQQ